MTLSALLLVLAAAILHATWNLAAKAKRGDSYLFVWWYTAVAALVTLPTGAVILARESAAGAPPEPALLWAPMVAAVLHIGYNLCLQTGYDRAPLSIVYPTARGTGPVLTMITAILLLGERPGLGAMTGAVVVILGIVLAALPALERLTVPLADDRSVDPLAPLARMRAALAVTLVERHQLSDAMLARLPHVVPGLAALDLDRVLARRRAS